MQFELRDLQVLTNKGFTPEKAKTFKPLHPFDRAVVEFLDVLSRKLLRDPIARQYPDIVTFAFWIRKSNIGILREDYERRHDFSKETLYGKGLVFHVAPSNVPINFAYSLVAGLLSGNANIVRVSNKDFPQTRIVTDAMEELLDGGLWPGIENLVTVVKYQRENAEWTALFSTICDIRIIWGGDETIKEIRKHQLQPNSIEICFPDRYSLCAIEAKAILSEENVATLAERFFNDTYLFDQNACTAPHLIIWVGDAETIEKAKPLFWGAVREYSGKKYPIAPIVAVDKLVAFCREAIGLGNVRREIDVDNTAVRVAVSSLSEEIQDNKSYGGYFNEFDARRLEEMTPVVTKKVQTLSYFGFSHNKIAEFLTQGNCVGIDRCVPMGKTMDFSLNWDGKYLVDALSRTVTF